MRTLHANARLLPWRLSHVGRFEVIQRLASTPFSDTLLVRDGDATRILRYISPWLSDDAVFREGFEHLSSAIVALDHPNIARVYEYGAINHRLYTVSERVEGITLERLLMPEGQTGLPPDIVTYIAHILCSALDAIHTLSDDSGQGFGLLYRNISPSHVFLLPDGKVVLRDPGPWQRLWLHGQPYSVVHRPTQLFRPAEDLEGDGFDERSDIFAVGRTLLALIRPPQASHTLEESVRDLRNNLAHLAHQAHPLAPVLERATATSSVFRYGTAAAMQSALPAMSDEVKTAVRAKIRARYAAYETSTKHAAPDDGTTPVERLSILDGGDVQVMHQRSDTVDLPLDSIPELLALRMRPASMPNQEALLRGFEYDAPPPTVPRRDPPPIRGDAPPSDLHERWHAPAIDDEPIAPTAHRRAPDPRVQTLTDALRRVVSTPAGCTVRDAARRRLAGDASGALHLLLHAPPDETPELQLAHDVELAFAYLEAGRYVEARSALLRLSTNDQLSADDTVLIAYYQAIAALALQQKRDADAALQRIAAADAARFPDLTSVRLLVSRLPDTL